MAIDTGTSLITGPSQDVVLLLRMINIDHSCENYDKMPVITFHIGEHEFDMHPKDYIMLSKN